MKIKKPIFVIGMPRSGTTIIAEAISVHERLGWFSNYFGNLPFFPEVSLLNRVADIPKIGHYLIGKKKQDVQLSALIRKLLPHFTEAYPVWSRYCNNRFEWDYMLNQSANESEKNRIRKIIKQVLIFQGKNRFFAKLTGPSRIHYLNSIFPDSIFVNVIRDPRANISSLLRVPFWKNGGGYDRPWWRSGLSDNSIREWINSGKSPVALAAVQWRDILEITWREKEKINRERFVEIHYEDFVRNPFKMISDIFEKIDLPGSDIVHRYLTSIGKVKDMNYKFRINLNHRDIDIIENLTLETAQKAGYFFTDNKPRT